MMIVFACLMLFIIIGLFALNQIFLEKYYIRYKEKDLKNVYEMISGAQSQKDLSQILSKNAWSVLEKSNIAILVKDQSGSLTIRETAGMGSDLLGKRLINNLFREKHGHRGEVLEKTDKYKIMRTIDGENHAEYVEMWGFLENGYCFIMRTPLDSIRASVKLTGQFYILMGSFMLLLSLFLIWYISQRITTPLLELADLSKRMASLDFDARYDRGGVDEIAILGESFNTMSHELEKAVSRLKKANATLQKDIEERDKIEEMRTEFLGNVSHELKTPIALIQGYAEGLKEGIADNDPESRDFYCDVIMDEAAKMNKMVKNLLALNQLEFGKDTVSFTRFDLVALIRGVLMSMQILIDQKNASLSFASEKSEMVWGDEFLVEQVVRNYVSNALNHVNKEKIIEVKIKETDKKVRVSVFNTGTPIPKEDVEHIWDKFYKVDKARTRAYGGNGIGLSIVKASMESMQQDYGVKNYSNGVEFYFELDR